MFSSNLMGPRWSVMCVTCLIRRAIDRFVSSLSSGDLLGLVGLLRLGPSNGHGSFLDDPGGRCLVLRMRCETRETSRDTSRDASAMICMSKSLFSRQRPCKVYLLASSHKRYITKQSWAITTLAINYMKNCLICLRWKQVKAGEIASLCHETTPCCVMDSMDRLLPQQL
jgi:hypothetical protein